jgi:hypothetical protein
VVATIAVVGATGGAVAAGVFASDGDAAVPDLAQAAGQGGSKAATSPRTESAPALRRPSPAARRALPERASRSVDRPPLLPGQRVAKAHALRGGQQEMSGAVTKTVEPTDPQDIARSMLPKYGWSSDQFSCLDEIYMRESRWDPSAANPYSGAYGIPQALPGDKMAAYGADWQTNPATQLAWGLSYIRDRYGSPCGAWGFWQSHNWY